MMLDKRIFGEVPEEVHQRLLDTLDTLEEKKRRSFKLPKIAIIIGACFVMSGITVSASVVQNMYRQHMESMNRQKMEEYCKMASKGEVSFRLSRELTDSEKARARQIRKNFKQLEQYPEEFITYLEEGDTYGGKGLALDSVNGILYIPETALSDDELLQMVDFENRVYYSLYILQQERITNGSDWLSRMSQMTDEEVNETYRIYFMGSVHISGDINRAYSQQEKRRYEELNLKYEEEGLYTENHVEIIKDEEEYSGKGVAFAMENSTFYLPDRELLDDELLQIIDFQHRATYSLNRINDEVNMGLRQQYPEF